MPKTKKVTIGFLAPLLTIFGLLLFWPGATQAQQANFFKEICKEDECCLQYTDAMAAAQSDWNAHVKSILAQPKATSKKVDEAFEGLRTYDCWVRYVCESVRLSAVVDPREIQDGIRAENLDGALPGCQKPEDVHFGNKWNEFLDALDDQEDVIAAINEPNKIAYFPECRLSPPFNETLSLSDFQEAELLYQNCVETAELILGCSDATCETNASALVELEIALKKDHAQQRADAMARKLYDINRRVSIMQQVVEQVKNYLTSLNLRYECAPFTQCT